MDYGLLKGASPHITKFVSNARVVQLRATHAGGQRCQHCQAWTGQAHNSFFPFFGTLHILNFWSLQYVDSLGELLDELLGGGKEGSISR